MLVFETGVRKSDATGKIIRAGFSSEQINEVLKNGGRLSFAQLMHCRVGYFTKGVAFGSRAFIEKLEPHLREAFGLQREREPCPIEEADTSLTVFRRPRRGRVGPRA